MLSIRCKKNGNLSISLDLPEAIVLQQLPERLRSLLRHPDFGNRVTKRLFPRAYSDTEREEEYRKLLADDLLKRKLESIQIFEASLQSARLRRDTVEVMVKSEQFEFWLGFVNDMRILLGTELDVEDGFGEEAFDPSDPRAEDMAVLHYLGYLEEELLQAIGFGMDGEESERGEERER